MAHTALRKTAKKAKETFPAAAKVIEDNTYIDGICDSVPTVKEANKLTTDLDSVLKTGGFQVKGWVSNKVEGTEKEEEKEQEMSPKELQWKRSWVWFGLAKETHCPSKNQKISLKAKKRFSSAEWHKSTIQ